MKHYKMTLAYSGQFFHGWQRQTEHLSIQQTLEQALFQLFHQTIPVLGSGRTDAGVHARGQVAKFSCPDTHKPEKLKMALNHLCSPHITILKLQPCLESFHPRYDAFFRHYNYYCGLKADLFPWQKDYIYPLKMPLDIDQLNTLAHTLLGWHDFTPFCSAQDKHGNKTRLVYYSHWQQIQNFYVYTIKANAFLWKMVRTLVGTMLYFQYHKLDEQDWQNIKENHQKSNIYCAPAHALFLEQVSYQAYQETSFPLNQERSSLFFPPQIKENTLTH